MSRRSEFEDAIVSEIAHWPGATVDLEMGGKHPVAVLGFDGLTARRPYAGTPSDSRFGKHKMLGDVRRALRDLGAMRDKPESTSDDGDDVKLSYRPPNDGKAKRPDPVEGERPAPVPTVAEQVAAIASNVVQRVDSLTELLGAPDIGPAKPRAAGNVLSEKTAAALDRDRPDLAPLRIKADPQVARDGWGFYTDIDAVDYHLDPCPEPSISNSLMGPILEKTPRDFAWQHPRRAELVADFPDLEDLRKSTAALVRGDVTHQLALGKGRGYAISPYDKWQSDKAKAWVKAAEADGLTPIKRKDFEEAEVLAAMLREGIKRALDGADYETEVVFMYQEQTRFGPVWVRGMLDVWCPERAIIIDPKVTARLYDGQVEKHALAMAWDRQAALYTHAVETLLPELAGRVEFADLMINPDPPHVSRLWAPEKAWEASSVRQCIMAIERFAECLYARDWPSFPAKRTRGPMPPWEDKRRTEMEIGS